MSYAEKWFDRIAKDAERAKSYFQQGNNAAVHYFLGRVSGDIRVIRDLLDDKPCESEEPSAES